MSYQHRKFQIDQVNVIPFYLDLDLLDCLTVRTVIPMDRCDHLSVQVSLHISQTLIAF